MTKNTMLPEASGQCSNSDRLPEEVLIADIIVDQKYQTRVEGIDEETVEEYQPIYAESPERMPPIELVRINGTLYLVAGFQRIEAARRAGCKSIRAIVIDGDEKTAMKEALGSNKHGLKLSKGDKTKAIRMALEIFPDYSNDVPIIYKTLRNQSNKSLSLRVVGGDKHYLTLYLQGDAAFEWHSKTNKVASRTPPDRSGAVFSYGRKSTFQELPGERRRPNKKEAECRRAEG